MIRNRKDLFKRLDNVAEMKIQQGIEIKTLIKSLEHKDYDFKKCKEVCKELIDKWME